MGKPCTIRQGLKTQSSCKALVRVGIRTSIHRGEEAGKETTESKQFNYLKSNKSQGTLTGTHTSNLGEQGQIVSSGI